MKFQKDIKVILTFELVEELKKCNRKAAPIEACGLIFGDVKKNNISDDEFQVFYIGKQFYCLKSNIESSGSFNLIRDTEKYFEIHQDAVDYKKLRLISIFHSHPVPPRPSSIDVANMKYLDDDIGNVRNPFKNQIWIIMDMRSEDINGFIYYKKEIMQVDLQIQKT